MMCANCQADVKDYQYAVTVHCGSQLGSPS
jgi:hypothetical protein